MPTLLVIDDNESVRTSLQFVFDTFGFMVVTAENGAAGLASAAQRPIDAALVDILMPGMNGFEVCRQIRNQVPSPGREIPVWLMTGALAGDFPRRAAEAGAVAIVSKPFDLAALEHAIRQRIVPA